MIALDAESSENLLGGQFPGGCWLKSKVDYKTNWLTLATKLQYGTVPKPLKRGRATVFSKIFSHGRGCRGGTALIDLAGMKYGARQVQESVCAIQAPTGEDVAF